MGLCAVSRWCEGCRNKGKAPLSSALDQISERITLAFQTLSRPEEIRGSTIENKNLHYISRGHGGEGGIRTPDRLAPMPHFECGAFNHSATSPRCAKSGAEPPRGRGRVLGEDGWPDKARNDNSAKSWTRRPGKSLPDLATFPARRAFTPIRIPIVLLTKSPRSSRTSA
jgi:hypothetical protein